MRLIITFLIIQNTLVSILFCQTNWQKYEVNPIFADSIKKWNINGAYGPCVLYEDTIYHMWYMGYDGANTRIGYATSNDGIHWEPYKSNPVLDLGSPGSWDETWVLYPYVLHRDSVFQMWYSGIQGKLNSPGYRERIGYATSPDGIHWIKADSVNPVLDVGAPGEWDDHGIDPGSVFYDGQQYHIWYGGYKTDFKVRTGYATSPDGIHWTKDTLNNPVLDLGVWDNNRVHQARVLYDGSKYHMFYGGGDYFLWRIGYATSTNGISWDKHNENPVLNIGLPDSWESRYVAVPSVMLQDSMFRMWYTGGRMELQGKIGYATSHLDTSIIESISLSNQNIPHDYIMHQNFPNPFNPKTVIGYQLPVSSDVELTIYNTLGQKVATLISEKQNAGGYSIEWDATGFSSGVYFYRIEAGEFCETKKLVLLK